MLRSMTAFCRREEKFQGAKWVFEIHTLNRKHLEVLFQIPKELQELESHFRKKIAQNFSRSRVTLTIQCLEYNENFQKIHLQEEYISQFINFANALSKKLNIETCNKSLFSTLLTDPKAIQLEKISVSKDSDFEKELLHSFSNLVDECVERKELEGEEINFDINNRLQNIQNQYEKIPYFLPEIELNYKKRLSDKLSSFEGVDENDERLLKELAIFTDKVDVSEELQRFGYHLKTFASLLKSEKVISGKKLEFITQELSREINTLGVKAAHPKLTTLVVDIKSELEKVREQLQNIE